jgi:hypothetical protein
MKKCQKHPGLAQQNGFGPAFLHTNAGKRHKQSSVPATEECDKYNLAAVPWFSNWPQS